MVESSDIAGNVAVSDAMIITVNRDTLDSSDKFIRQIYYDARGRPGSLAEWQIWLPLLAQSNGRFVIANAIERSLESRDFLVKGWYQTYLGRPAVGGEEMGWAQAMVNGMSPEQALSLLLASQEYFNRAPSIPNVGGLGDDVVEAGDTIAIEPFSTNGAGKVEGKKSGNIYRLLSPREIAPAALNEFLRKLEASFKTLPFAERWAYALDRKAPAYLSRLLRAGRIMTYESLLDAGRGIVAQTEHTMIVDDGGVEVTTR